MIRMKHPLFTSLLCAGFLFAADVAADTLVVYSAKGGSYKSGAMVESGDVLKLAPGEELSLISPTGKIIKLVGPFEGAPLPKGERRDKKSVKEAIRNLLSAKDDAVESFGITRSSDAVLALAGQPAPLPSPWVVDITQNVPYCYQEGKKIIFWRPDKSQEATIKINIVDNGWQAQAVWAEGKSKIALPDTMPVLDGAVYVITLDGVKASGRLNVVPKTVKSQLAQAAWLKAKGCIPQFETLVRSFL